MQKVNPPAEVIDSFLDVQAARSDLERAQNEAQTYANRVVPEARGRAAKIIQDAEAYREQTVAEAKGQTSRFLQIYDQYKKAPDVTRERMYLETMERILGENDKTIIDTGRRPDRASCPICRSPNCRGRGQPPRNRAAPRREATNEARPRRRRRSPSSSSSPPSSATALCSP